MAEKTEVERFLDDVATNAALREKVMASTAVAIVAATRGYHFTAKELDDALRARWGADYDKVFLRFCFSEVPGF